MTPAAAVPVVVCSRPLPDEGQHLRLEGLAEVVVARGEAFAPALGEADAAVVIRPDRLTRAMVAGAPRLRAVATVSSGVDHIDRGALEERGIQVIAGTGAAPGAVAEWVVWAVLTARRGFSTMAARFTRGELDWGTRLAGYRADEVAGATVGIVGFGHIGQEVRRLLAPFGPRFVVFDPAAPALPPGCEAAASVADLCARADVVTVHVPLVAATRGLLGRDELHLLGPDGLVVNAARGGVIDQAALLDALSTGALGAAAVDCFDPEPADPAYVAALAATGRAVLTPHVAGVSRQSLAALCHTAVDGLAASLGRTAAVAP